MQVMCGGNAASDPNWHKTGDWLDTVANNGRVRFRADRYGGTITMHCHILEHEDAGAMGVFYVNGGCDGNYTDSTALSSGDYPTCDSTCSYTSIFYDSTPSPTANYSVCVPNILLLLALLVSLGFVLLVLIIVGITLCCLNWKGYIKFVKCCTKKESEDGKCKCINKCCIKWLGKEGVKRKQEEKALKTKEPEIAVPQTSRQDSLNNLDNAIQTGIQTTTDDGDGDGNGDAGAADAATSNP